MGSTDRISLRNEFEDHCVDNDYILLTTFTFDPLFFDAFLLRKIERNNVGSDIAVIVDSGQYFESYERFTSITGRNYRLTPVFLKQGVFHPKVSLFFSEKARKATLFIGSSNLTLRGFTENAEVVAKFEFDLKNEVSETFLSVLRMFSLLCSKDLLRDANVASLVNDIQESPLLQDTHVVPSDEFVFLHNIEKPILDQVNDVVGNRKFESLMILAPFISETNTVLQELLAKIEVRKIILCLQPGNHTVTDLGAFEKFCKLRRVPFEVAEVRLKSLDEKTRKFHSKLLYFRGKEDFLLVGSPNFTVNALLKTAENGNLEAGLLHKGGIGRSIVSEIVTEAPKDLNELLQSGSLHEFGGTTDRIRVYSADFDRITRNLTIETDPQETIAEIDVRTDEPLRHFSFQHSLSIGKAQIAVREGFPVEAIVTIGKKSTPIRIFQNKNYFLKRIARATSTLTEISDMIFNDLSLGISDSMDVLRSLAAGVDFEAPTHSGRTIVSRPRIARPAREGSVGSPSGLLRTLAQLYELLSVKQRQQEVEESIRDKTESEPELTRDYPAKYEENEARAKLVRKIIDSLNEVLEAWSTRRGNDPDSVLSSQSLLLHYYFKLFRPLTQDGTILSDTLGILEENLNRSELRGASRLSKVKLFAYSVLAFYVYRSRSNPKFLTRGEIFGYDDVVTPDAYTKAAELAQKMLSAFANSPFAISEFNIWYARLARDSIPGEQLDSRIIQLCSDIDRQTGDFNDMLVHLLEELGNRWSISRGLRAKIMGLEYHNRLTVELLKRFVESLPN